jgi:hypothetical protein
LFIVHQLILYRAGNRAFHADVISIKVNADAVGTEFVFFLEYNREAGKVQQLFYATVYGVFSAAYHLVLEKPHSNLKHRFLALVIVLNETTLGDNAVLPVFQRGIALKPRNLQLPVVTQAVGLEHNVLLLFPPPDPARTFDELVVIPLNLNSRRLEQNVIRAHLGVSYEYGDFLARRPTAAHAISPEGKGIGIRARKRDTQKQE